MMLPSWNRLRGGYSRHGGHGHTLHRIAMGLQRRDLSSRPHRPAHPAVAARQSTSAWRRQRRRQTPARSGGAAPANGRATGIAAGASTCGSCSRRAAKAGEERAAGRRAHRQIVGTHGVADQVVMRPGRTIFVIQLGNKLVQMLFAEQLTVDKSGQTLASRACLRLHRDRPHDAPHLTDTPSDTT